MTDPSATPDGAGERDDTERGERDDTEEAEGQADGRESGRRDVEVPLRLYKTITVFSTLIAVFGVVFGFVLLDAATLQVSLLRRAVVGALGVVGVVPDGDLLSAAFAGAGLASIGLGAAVYVLGTRFRARGMGKSQEDSDEPSDNG